MVNVPGNGTKPCFMLDPYMRMQKWGGNLMTDSVNLESKLMGIDRKLDFDCTKYDDKPVTRAEILYLNLDDATRAAMLKQLNAERARRTQVIEAEGRKRTVELAADAQLYEAEQIAKARRIQAEAEAFATSVIAQAIAENGIEAAQYQVALKQVEALTAVGNSESDQTVILPANALDAFADAFKMLKGRG